MKRAMNVGDYEVSDVDGDANSGSNDDDDGYPPPPPSSSSPPTVSKTVSKKRKHHAAPTAGAIEEGSLCVATLPDSYARPSETLAPQRRRRLELSVVKDNIPV